jgi:hypothetical protein
VGVGGLNNPNPNPNQIIMSNLAPYAGVKIVIIMALVGMMIFTYIVKIVRNRTKVVRFGPAQTPPSLSELADLETGPFTP